MTKVAYFKKVLCQLAVMLCILTIGGASATITYPSADPTGNGPAVALEQARISNILVLLEHRGADQRVLGKATEKLRTLSSPQLRLMSSLCDRILASGGAENGDTAGADIAFSLITALIVLS